MTSEAVPRSRLLGRDLLGVGSVGLRTRRARAALSALGVAIGIASMVAVLGISASSRAELLRTIDSLGTNLLTVEPGQSFIGGGDSTLPVSARARIASLPGVERSASVYEASGATVRRTSYVDEQQTSGITVYGADRSLLRTMSASMRSGSFLSANDDRFPVVVLGSVAARRLGLTDVASRPQVWIGDRSYRVVGIMDDVTLDSSLDRAALVSTAQVRALTGAAADEVTPAKVYVRADEVALERVRGLLAPSANAEHAEEVDVSRPSDALEAKAAAEGAFTSLLLGLGAVALLVGGVGIANVMVISVLERRSEIGLRRALGATRGHITSQFLTESVLLGGLGGVAGAALGALVTVVYAVSQGLPAVVPLGAVVGGMAAAVIIGAVAGLWPSMRAARLSPTEALRAV
jgi:putative ABC transport system permease protein